MTDMSAIGWPRQAPSDTLETHTRQAHLGRYQLPSRNGRTLADNAPEVMLSLVTGTAVPAGLTPAVAQHLRSASFPHVKPE